MDSVELQNNIFVISEAIDFAGVVIIALGAVIGVIVTVLAIIVLVRTVLSLSIDVEIDGRWPWQAAQQKAVTEMAETTGSGGSARSEARRRR